MRIVEVRTQPVRYRYPERPPMSGGGVNAQREALLVFLHTDTGLVGIGEAGVAGGPTVSTRTVVERELAPLVVGQDPFEVERLWRLMAVRTRQHGRRGLLLHAIAGVDIALWDLIGKVVGQPMSVLKMAPMRRRPRPSRLLSCWGIEVALPLAGPRPAGTVRRAPRVRSGA